ncbi:MAG: MFS transporter [Alphaproteobacteria bacterium]
MPTQRDPTLTTDHATTEPPGGWGLVVALALCQLVSWGTIYYGFALFVAPMEAEFGWSRAAINGAASAGLLVSGGCAYAMGRWIDRWGGRWLMAAGSVLAGVLLALWSRVASLTELYVIWMLMGVAMAAMLYQALFAVLTRRFRASFRRRITVVTLIAGFASTVFIPMTQGLIDALGWRDALLALAATQILLCLPVHAFGLRDGGLRDGGLRDGGWPARVSDAGRGAGRGERARDVARRTLSQPAFWALALCFTATSLINSVIAFHAVPLILERGFPTTLAVTVIALIGPAQVAFRLVVFALGPRADSAAVGRVAMAFLPAAMALLVAWPHSAAALVAFALVFGGVNGTMTIVRATAVADFLGRADYGAVSGLLALPTTVAHAAAPLLAALVWAAFGGYDAVVVAMAGAGAIAAVAFWLAVWLARGAGRIAA